VQWLLERRERNSGLVVAEFTGPVLMLLSLLNLLGLCCLTHKSEHSLVLKICSDSLSCSVVMITAQIVLRLAAFG
jgi:hypothetical protein